MQLIVLISFILTVINPGRITAEDGFLKKVKQHKNEFREMADYLIEKKYHKEFAQPVVFIDPLEIDNAEIKAFCKQFDITSITVENYKDKGYTVPMDSVIVFHRDYTPIVGNQRDVIIDFASENRSYADFHEHGSQLVKIDSRIYYYKH